MAGINIHDVDLFSTMKKVYSNGGAIFYDRVPGGTSNATASGTGTSRTSISTSYAIPPVAKEILAISPGLASTADAAADIKMAMVDIQGTAFKRQPQQVLAPIGSTVLSAGATRFTPQEWFKVCAPVVAGDIYDWGVTPLVANTHNMSAWVDVMYSTVLSGDPVIFSQVSTASAFKAAGANSSGTLTLTAAAGLYEVGSATSGESALAAQETQIISHQLQCSALNPIQQITYGNDTPAQVAATSGDSQAGQIIRNPTYGMSFKIPNPTLTYTTIIKTATTNNMNVAHMARYTTF